MRSSATDHELPGFISKSRNPRSPDEKQTTWQRRRLRRASSTKVSVTAFDQISFSPAIDELVSRHTTSGPCPRWSVPRKRVGEDAAVEQAALEVAPQERVRQRDQLVRDQASEVLEAAPGPDLVQLLVGAVEHAAAHRERLVAHAAEHAEQPAHLGVVGEAPAEVDALPGIARAAGADAASPRLQRLVQIGHLARGRRRGAEQLLVELLLDARERRRDAPALLLALRRDAARGEACLVGRGAHARARRRARVPARPDARRRIGLAVGAVRRPPPPGGSGASSSSVPRRLSRPRASASSPRLRARSLARLVGELAADRGLLLGLARGFLLALQVPQVEQVAAGQHAVLAQRAQHATRRSARRRGRRAPRRARVCRRSISYAGPAGRRPARAG